MCVLRESFPPPKKSTNLFLNWLDSQALVRGGNAGNRKEKSFKQGDINPEVSNGSMLEMGDSLLVLFPESCWGRPKVRKTSWYGVFCNLCSKLEFHMNSHGFSKCCWSFQVVNTPGFCLLIGMTKYLRTWHLWMLFSRSFGGVRQISSRWQGWECVKLLTWIVDFSYNTVDGSEIRLTTLKIFETLLEKWDILHMNWCRISEKQQYSC